MRYGLGPVVVLAGTQMVEQGERLSLSQALDGIKGEFGVSDGALGAIAIATTVVGAIGALPFGWLADRWRRPVLLGGAMVAWTACMGLNAFAPGLLLIYVARLGIGFVEANGPAVVSLISDYYPVERRARMLGYFQLGAAAGGILGIGVAGVLIDAFDWRAAFWMWLPLGLVVALLVSRLPDPERGAQDTHLEELEPADEVLGGQGLLADERLVARLDLPEPARVGTLDYATADARAVLKELLTIRSMWFAVVGLTISQFFLAALGYWGIEFFKRAHGLSASAAGLYAAVLGLGSFVGLAGGGILADRLLRRGHLNARVVVASVGSIAATFVLIPALLVDGLVLSGVLFFFSGLFVTLPVAPSEALMTDVVVAQIRGRAASIRSVVRSVGNASPALIGVLSDATDLRSALAITAPLYVVGGVVMLFAARTYPADLAFVAAESERIRRQDRSAAGAIP
jgi:predicted MFS family arabinose efflux permease